MWYNYCMDYEKHYTKMISRARDRTLDGYSEKHHIIPKCQGGNNDKFNIVRLTPEEHYVAHLLLVKIHPSNYRLLWAAVAMTNQTKNMRRGNKLYGWLRRRFSMEMSKRPTGRKQTKEARRKMSESRRGVTRGPHSEKTKSKMSKASKGRKKSNAHCKAISIAKTGIKQGPHSEEHNKKIKEANIKTAKNKDYSWRQDRDYKKQQSEKMREIWRLRKEGKLSMPIRGIKEI